MTMTIGNMTAVLEIMYTAAGQVASAVGQVASNGSEFTRWYGRNMDAALPVCEVVAGAVTVGVGLWLVAHPVPVDRTRVVALPVQQQGAAVQAQAEPNTWTQKASLVATMACRLFVGLTGTVIGCAAYAEGFVRITEPLTNNI